MKTCLNFNGSHGCDDPDCEPCEVLFGAWRCQHLATSSEGCKYYEQEKEQGRAYFKQQEIDLAKEVALGDDRYTGPATA